MNKKAFAILTLAAMMLAAMPLANSQPSPPTWSIWTNKPEYAPGESGTLYIRYYNGGSNPVTIEKVYIVFTEWRAYIKGKWEGNVTIQANQAVIGHGVYENETRFVVPADGRAMDTQVEVIIKTSSGTISSTYEAPLTISVPSTPRSMDQVVTLFTILLVLVMVSTVIIAAAIFLSARRPQVMWSKEEKVP